MIPLSAGYLATWVLYWRVPNRYKEMVLAGAGVAGVTWYDPRAAVILAGLILCVWIGTSKRSGALNVIAIALVIAGFCTYKLIANGGPFDQGVVVLGLAYAVPRALHVLMDVRYRGTHRPSFLTLNAYFWFFPLVVVGPIHRLGEFERGTRRCRFDATVVGLGLERVLVGLVSVKVIGDWVISVRLTNYINQLGRSRDGLAALLRSVEYGLNLYFQFAGWSAVAIGLAATLGRDTPENFHRPFAQPNIAAFWRSWHVTLTRWTNEYVFQPVAAQTRRPAIGIVATMLAIALWHEFSARYVLWALWHAAGLVLHRWFQALDIGSRLPRRLRPRSAQAASTTVTIAFVFLGFTITRVDTVGDALAEFGAIFSGGYR